MKTYIPGFAPVHDHEETTEPAPLPAAPAVLPSITEAIAAAEARQELINNNNAPVFVEDPIEYPDLPHTETILVPTSRR